MAFYICSLRNDKGAGRIPQLITDDPAAVEAFAKKWDVPGRGVFECIGYLKPGATRRCRETVGTLWRLPVDIDFKDWVETPEEIDRTLQALPLPLSWARNSGDGRHVEYLLKEHAQVGDEEYFERASQALKQLAVRLSGDPLPTHPAALLRKPLTHNSKRGEPVLVAPLWGNGQAFDLTEVEALIELLPEAGLFTPKTRGNGHDRAEGGPRLAGEYKAPVDVDRRLADMRHKGPGDSSIHYTELHCTGSLVRCGCPVDDTVFTVLQAVRKAVANDPSAASWDWTQEELDIRKMCTDLVCKSPELSATLPDSLREPFEAAVAAGRRPKIVYASHIGWHVRSWEARQAKDEAEAPAQSEAGAKAEPKKYRFPLIAFDELRPGSEQSYLIDELFPIAGLALVYGAPKAGKSFWAFDAMMHVALGWEYRDRAVQQGPVVYCAFEGAHGYRKRGEAFRRHHCLTDEKPPLFVIPGRADLIKDHAALIADIRGQLKERGVTKPPKAVALDTLNKSLTGSESKDVDMANYIAAAEAIQKAFGCLVIIVHHHGIEESRPRGHTSLRGAVDAQIKITRDEQNNIIAEIEDMRDGPEGAQIASRLVVVEVGTDLTGKHITSAAIEPVDAPNPEQRLPRLTPNQRTMLSLLEEAGPSGLSVNEWNDKARTAGLGKHRRATLADLRADLRRKGLVIERGGAWIVVSDRNRDL